MIVHILKLLVGLGLLFCSIFLVIFFVVSLFGTIEDFKEWKWTAECFMYGVLGFGGLSFYLIVIDYHNKVYMKERESKK